MYSLPATLQLAQEIRELRIPDVLLIKHTLWHAWHSVTSKLTTGKGVWAMTRKQHKNARQRKSDGGQNDRARRRREILILTGQETEEGFKAKYVVRCPDPACGARDRRFNIPGIFAHM